jgi:hypothetical protein
MLPHRPPNRAQRNDRGPGLESGTGGGTLQNNLGKADFSTVLLDVMAIADEVDSQLKQTVLGFMAAVPPKPVSLSAETLI